MARSLLVPALITAWSVAAVAEPLPSPTPPLAPPANDALSGRPEGPRPRMSHPARGRDNEAKPPESGDDGRFKRFRSRLDQISPEEREHFKENWKRWSGMADKEQKDWQKRAGADRERMKKVVDDAIAATGLTLNGDRKEIFALRYCQERRKVEEKLHADLEARRDKEMADVLARLKVEFSAAPAFPSATPTPSATP